jgi:hypothetical protein
MLAFGQANDIGGRSATGAIQTSILPRGEGERSPALNGADARKIPVAEQSPEETTPLTVDRRRPDACHNKGVPAIPTRESFVMPDIERIEETPAQVIGRTAVNGF